MRHLAAEFSRRRDAAHEINSTLRTRSPLKFFLLVFAYSIQFWLIGAVASLQLMPVKHLRNLMQRRRQKAARHSNVDQVKSR